MTKKRHLILTLISSVFLVMLSDAYESEFQKALDLSNAGQTQSAIQLLEDLSQKHPTDARLLLNLGLLYQSVDQIDTAIGVLEKAVSLSANAEGYYSLGLLYESKIASGQSNSVGLAQNAWERFLQTATSHHPYRSTVEEKLKRLKN